MYVCMFACICHKLHLSVLNLGAHEHCANTDQAYIHTSQIYTVSRALGANIYIQKYTHPSICKYIHTCVQAYIHTRNPHIHTWNTLIRQLQFTQHLANQVHIHTYIHTRNPHIYTWNALIWHLQFTQCLANQAHKRGALVAPKFQRLFRGGPGRCPGFTAFACVCVWVCVNVCVCMYVCMNECVRVYVCMYICARDVD